MELANNPAPNAAASQAWGADPLSAFIDIAHANARRTFSNDRERCDAVIEVDALYRHLISNLGGTSEQLAGSLLMRTHGLLLGAVSMALSGMAAESYALLSRSLKTAMQGVFVAANPTRQKLWTNRNNDDASRSAMQDEFKNEKLRRHLRQLDASTAEICDKLLRRTRDHSDHPNTYADVFSKPATKGKRFDVAREYFVADDEVQRFCLRSAAQVGICCLTIFFYVFPDHYREAGIPDRLTALRQGH